MNPNKSFCVASALIITALLMLAYFYLRIERVEYDMIKVQKTGGIHDITEQGLNAAEMENLARFAVDRYSGTVNCIIRFHRLVKAKEQTVAGKIYHLTIETQAGLGEIEVYEAKVWVKPWMDFMELQEFKLIKDPNV
ncbi:hypothetical protein LXL04_032707 [Taraxacum kok-saghyz]